ncbi:MAG: hypothetical protein BMS9Abin15_0618 [Gammaproteobacteria bacterium]|nr:MAG: hypothetical protein BMS9Abin15_0618 [Gammaproteobacteria bacterium]
MPKFQGCHLFGAHVTRVFEPIRKRTFLHYVAKYLQGQMLRQWMHDHPAGALSGARPILEQSAKGLRVFHRAEMLHQDLKPENIFIGSDGVVIIIDFDPTWIAGINEISTPVERITILGTANYTASEYMLGYSGSAQSDIYPSRYYVRNADR